MERTWRDGAAHASGVLTRSALRMLGAYVRDAMELRAADPQVGEVEQCASMAVVAGGALRSSVAGELARDFGALARRYGAPLVSDTFEPNEVTVMSYRGRHSGIGPHLDRRRYRELVAVFSLWGCAQLDVVADRAGCERLRGWDCAAGDLVLLRAPGLGGITDGRLLHRVGVPRRRSRASLSLRMDVGTPSPWLFER